MKKFGIFLLMMAAATFASAQDKSADEYKNEGNEFVRNKNFAGALESYKKAISLWGDSVDAATVYNAGMCAQKTKSLDEAYTYYAKAQELGYKEADAAYRMTTILKAQKKLDEYAEAVKQGFEKYKNGKTGNRFRQDYAKLFRDKAFALYNEGAEITKTMQTAAADKMDALKASAKAKFSEAKPLIEQALEIYPDDANAKTIKEGIEKQLASL